MQERPSLLSKVYQLTRRETIIELPKKGTERNAPAYFRRPHMNVTSATGPCESANWLAADSELSPFSVFP